MANYLYNGVELPSLPDWDKETHPYAVIIKHSNGYLFAARSTAFTAAAESGYMVGEASVKYLAVDGVWTTSTLAVSGGVIWANHDIYLTADATALVLAASSPVPVTTAAPIEPTSFMQGWLVGKKIAAMRGKVNSGETEEPSGTIVGYSYNGVQAPAFPDYDSGTYPYTVLRHNSEATIQFQLYCCVSPPTINSAGKIVFANSSKGKCTAYSYIDGEWVGTNYTAFAGLKTEVDGICWTNTDILNSDGTTYLAASEPVPVY